MAINTGGNVYNTALSGLNAAQTRLNVSAQNVANSSTEGYKALSATSRSVETGGVIVDVRTQTPLSLSAPNPSGEGTVEVPNVSFDQEVVNQIQASNDFKANLNVLKVQQRLDKALFDITA